MLSPLGGTPADEDKGRDMIGTLNADETAHRIAAAVPFLEQHPESTGKVGAVGFCWGGGMVNRVAVLAPDLKAAVAYYGAAAAGRPGAVDPRAVAAALCRARPAHRMPASRPTRRRSRPTSKRYTIYIYPNVNHAFNNDTSNRYDKPAADLAWSRTIAFFKENLGAPPSQGVKSGGTPALRRARYAKRRINIEDDMADAITA